MKSALDPNENLRGSHTIFVQAISAQVREHSHKSTSTILHIMAISIQKPMDSDSIFKVGRNPEDLIQIFLPPKPGTQEDPTTASKTGDSATSLSVGNFLSFSSLHNQEEDLASSKLPFVWKLYEMLEDVEKNGDEHIVSWVDGGKAFKVHKLKPFVDDIIPRYFRQSKYKSFQRQLYFYEFTRVQTGSHAGAYCHPKFVKGVKTLCLSMTPKKTQRRSSKKKVTENNKTESSAPEQPQNKEAQSDPSEWMTQIENLMTYGAHTANDTRQQRRRSSAYESVDETTLERSGPSDGDIVFIFGGTPFHFVETEFADLPRY